MGQFTIPNILTNWPWPRQLNLHYKEIGAASTAWIDSFQLLSADKKKALDKCNINLLSCLAYPLANKEQLRSACDLVHLFFFFDELSDSGSGPAVRQQANIIMDALRNPDVLRPEGEVAIGEMTRQFWSRTLRCANPSPLTQQRFIRVIDAYTTAVEIEAEDRDQRLIRDIESYFTVRRGTVGMYAAFVLFELGMDLSENVLDHPVIVDMERCIADIVIIANDVYSYNVEQARGDDGHNLVTVVMKDLGTDLHGASQWIEEYSAGIEAQFLNAIALLPTWGEEVDRQVAKYVYGLGNWARANDAWSFEGERYFGKDGLRIQKSRKVMLAKRSDAEPNAI
ncbi:terpenoid synthase [Phlebopus sp. FC_14]|nr:terpenoid synthase [Phlebopus sp. FC_14]